MCSLYEEVKNREYKLECFESTELSELSTKINRYLYEPMEGNLNFRRVPIDLSFTSVVLPNVHHVGEIVSVYNQVEYKAVLLYENVYSS